MSIDCQQTLQDREEVRNAITAVTGITADGSDDTTGQGAATASVGVVFAVVAATAVGAALLRGAVNKFRARGGRAHEEHAAAEDIKLEATLDDVEAEVAAA